MGYVQRLVVCLVLVITVMQMPTPAMAAESPGLQYVHTPQRFDGSTDQLVVRLQPGLQRSSVDTGFWRQFSQSARNETAVLARYQRQFRDDTHILRVSRNLDVKQLDAVIKAWSRIPGVELVEPDVRTFPIATPNDIRYSDQWSLVESGTVIDGKTYYGIGVERAWDKGYTGSGAVVAVLDTGILPHPDLAGQVIEQYDFISYTSVSGDGDGRDGDATDEGDYGTCWGQYENSSWHGTHVAGTIAAVTNNGAGVAGVAPDAKLIIGRVLGTCGGYPSDIADAIRWAAGVGSPSNPNPADVINLSLGGAASSCLSYYASAIAAAQTAGATVVIAAGNSNMDTSGFTPANCSGALTVASTGGTGKRASYSNYGELVDVAAPGGNYPDYILSTWYSGLTTNTSGSYDYGYMQGTSMATPHVAGIAALWHGSDPTLTPAEVAANIIDTAEPFPTDASSTGCAVLLCGSGIASAANMLPAQTFTTALPTTVVYQETADLEAVSDQAISGTWRVDTGSTRICSITDTTVTGLLPGNCVLNYTNNGSTDYRRLRMSHTIVVTKAEQAFTNLSLPTNVVGTSTSDAFSLTSDEGLRGKWITTTPEFCKVLGNRIRGVAPGDCEMVFTQSTGNTYYKPFVYTDTVTIDPKLTQNFTSGLPASVTGTSSSTAFAIVSDEGLKGKWTTTDRTICRMRGSNMVTGVAPGTCTVVFTNRGSSMYESFVYTDTITIDPKLSQTYTTAMPADVVGTNTSGIMALASDEGIKGKWGTTDRTICRMRGSNMVTGVAPGTCTVVFTNRGSSMYESFVYTDTITILPKLTQSYTSAIPANVVGTDTSAAISLYSDEGIKGKWTTSTGTICKVIGGNKIRGVSPGECVLQYTNRGNSTYEAVVSSSPITATVTIDPKLTQTFSGVVPNSMTIGQTFAAVFATDEGLALKVVATPTSVCRYGAGVVTARAAGTCTVTVSNRATPIYEAFTQTFSITITP